jgi:hypothetical protein
VPPVETVTTGLAAVEVNEAGPDHAYVSEPPATVTVVAESVKEAPVQSVSDEVVITDITG